MQNTGAVLQKVGETHLSTLSRHWGATERGWGHEERATYTILFESSIVNTGESSVDGRRSPRVGSMAATAIAHQHHGVPRVAKETHPLMEVLAAGLRINMGDDSYRSPVVTP